MKKPESFEVTEYGEQNEVLSKYSTIRQIVDEHKREFPNAGIRCSFAGNMVKIMYHAYEMHLPVRMKEIQDQANDMLSSALKHIKKEFKSRRKETLNLKEKKDLANYTAQKVSLNERYYAVFWRMYELE